MNPDDDMNSCDVPEEVGYVLPVTWAIELLSLQLSLSLFVLQNYINDVEYAQEPEPLSAPSPGVPSKKAKSKGRGRGKQAVRG